MTSLYIECLGSMGQVISRATGFVVRGEKAMPYLVTNRHVVTGRNSLDGNKPDSRPLRQVDVSHENVVCDTRTTLTLRLRHAA
jgi:hypothetical protein